jgi:hypothetical protein
LKVCVGNKKRLSVTPYRLNAAPKN